MPPVDALHALVWSAWADEIYKACKDGVEFNPVVYCVSVIVSLNVLPFSSVAVNVKEPWALLPERLIFTLKFPLPLDEDNAALLLPELESDKEILPSPAIATDIGETTPFTL